MSNFKWVYAPERLRDIPEDTVGKVLDERAYTYQICWFTTAGAQISVIPKSEVKEYPIRQELTDLAHLLFEAKMMGDIEWFEDLKSRYDLLKHVCDQTPGHSSDVSEPLKEVSRH